jgi:hypothetical protein
MPNIAFIVLCKLWLTTSAPKISVDLVFEGLPISTRTEDAALREVNLIWGVYGVDVRAASPDAVPRAHAVRLAVVLAEHADRNVAAGSLGSIQFTDHVPEPVVVVYPHTIAGVVSAGLSRRGHTETASAFRDPFVGRAMGRALAHEIGHYLLQSSDHSTTGLMRAQLLVADLMAIDPRGRFFLVAEGVTRLVSILPDGRSRRAEAPNP